MTPRTLLSIALSLGLAGMLAATPRPQTTRANYTLKPAWPAIELSKPLDLQFTTDGNALVIEKSGLIRRLPKDRNADKAPVVCDLRKRVSMAANEMGLLGMALDPKTPDGTKLYVNYTAEGPRRTVIARIRDLDPRKHDTLLEIRQPFGNHNGGCLRFGPDGMLYIGMGDGGGAGDPSGNGQNRKTLLAAMLRIDVSKKDDGIAYAIPADNPLAGDTTGLRRELWAWGLRNPWRFSFDDETGDLWAGDVGQNRFEEVTLVPRGSNCGWNLKEGFADYDADAEAATKPLHPPLHSYPLKYGRSIVGGYIYRGKRHPELKDHYLFADFYSGRIWALKRTGDKVDVRQLLDSRVLVASINPDPEGEPLFLGYRGTIYSLESPDKRLR